MLFSAIDGNGLIIQWGKVTKSSARSFSGPTSIPLSYTSTSSFNAYIIPTSSTINSAGVSTYNTGTSEFNWVVYGVASSDRFIGMKWVTIGY